jgi:hypothetical protein
MHVMNKTYFRSAILRRTSVTLIAVMMFSACGDAFMDERALKGRIEEMVKSIERRDCNSVFTFLSPVDHPERPMSEKLASCAKGINDDVQREGHVMALKTTLTMKPTFNSTKTIAVFDLTGLGLPAREIKFVRIAGLWYAKDE